MKTLWVRLEVPDDLQLDYAENEIITALRYHTENITGVLVLTNMEMDIGYGGDHV